MSEYYRPEECRELLDKLTRCFFERSLMKYFGVCDEYKIKHDRCCRSEYEKRRNANYKKSLLKEKAENV